MSSLADVVVECGGGFRTLGRCCSTSPERALGGIEGCDAFDSASCQSWFDASEGTDVRDTQQTQADARDDNALGEGWSRSFLVIGIALFVLTVAAELWFEPVANTLASVGASLVAIWFVDWSWRKRGGAPLQRLIMHLQGQITHFSSSTENALSDLRTATAALNDLQETGVVRLYSTRWDDGDKRRGDWLTRLHKAREVDLMGLNLWTQWFEHEPLCNGLKEVVNSGGKVRIALHPKLDQGDCPSATLRSQQPGEQGQPLTLKDLLRSSHTRLENLLKDQEIAAHPERFEVHYVRTATIYSMMVRIDGYMFIAPYLATRLGEESIAMEVNGPGRPFFNTYHNEFNTVLQKL